jgi:hypothetical protein
MYSPENPLSKYWDRELQDSLPDSRLSGPGRRSTQIYWGNMLMEKVFCANCGADGGLITADWSPHVFFLCDSCAYGNGPPPGCAEVESTKLRGFN